MWIFPGVHLHTYLRNFRFQVTWYREDLEPGTVGNGESCWSTCQGFGPQIAMLFTFTLDICYTIILLPKGKRIASLSKTAIALGSSAIRCWFRGIVVLHWTLLWKVPPRFYQGCANFVISLGFWGRSEKGCRKVQWKVPPSFLQTHLPVPQLFFAFWPNSISFGSQNDTFVFWGALCSKWLRLPKGSSEWSPNSSLLRFFGQMAVAPQKFFGGFRQLCFTFISQSPPAVNVAWIVELTCLTQSAENDPSCRCCWGILWAYLDDSMIR